LQFCVIYKIDEVEAKNTYTQSLFRRQLFGLGRSVKEIQWKLDLLLSRRIVVPERVVVEEEPTLENMNTITYDAKDNNISHTIISSGVMIPGKRSTMQLI